MSAVLTDIRNTVRHEFSDLPDAGEVTRVVLQRAIAAVPGGLLAILASLPLVSRLPHRGKP